jgi:hypothetical protein
MALISGGILIGLLVAEGLVRWIRELRSAAGHRPPVWHDIYQGHLSPEGHRAVTEILLNEVVTPAESR